MRAIVFKELREVAGITGLALVAYLLLVVSLTGAAQIPLMPVGTNQIPFTGSEFITPFCWITGLFAIALGMRQSVWEGMSGTYLFLLHRPIERHSIFLAKLATGSIVLLLCPCIPIVLYGWWAATPSHHASPFFWSLTLAAWKLVVLFPLLYLAAFLSGLRPARWYGTRLLPIVAIGGAIFVAANIESLDMPFVSLTALLLYFAMSATICYVARMREYS